MEGPSSQENLSSGSPKEIPRQRESLDRKFVEVNGIRTSYIERGNPHGIPLMYIGGHMSSASGDRWFLDALEGKIPNSKGFRALSENKPTSAEKLKENLAGLRQKYRILDLELPGFGKSSSLKGKVTLDRMADFAAEFQKNLGAENAIIFGSSMGGIVAIKLAARHPEAAKAVFLQGVMTEASDMDKMTYKAAQIATHPFLPIRYFLRIPGVAPKVFSFLAKTNKDFKMSEKEAQDAMIEGARSAHTKTALSTLREIGQDLGEEIKNVQCPVVVVDGSAAEMVTFEKQKMAAQRFPEQNLTYGKTYGDKNPSGVKTVKAIPLAVSEAFGEQGHSVVNTAPEILAVLLDKMFKKLSELTRTNENSGPTPGIEPQ